MSIIVAGPASEELAYTTAKFANLECTTTNTRTFPDGEIKITIPGAEKLEGEDAVIIQSIYPPVNKHLIELLFIIGKVREHANRITLVTPYLAYARQDREFLKGESVSMSHIATILEAFNIDKVITIDIHSRLALSYIKNSVNLSAIPLLAERLRSIDDAIVVSPDVGGKQRAMKLASLLNVDAIALPKHRDRDTGEVKIDEDASILTKVDRKNVIIVDDMISTGGSIIKASNILKSRCRNIYVACTHALLLNDSYKKIMDNVKDIISTNTIPNPASKVDISSIVIEAI